MLDAAEPQNSRFPAFVELAGNFFWGSGSLTIRLFPPYVIFLTYFLMVNNTYYFSKEDHHDLLREDVVKHAYSRASATMKAGILLQCVRYALV